MPPRRYQFNPPTNPLLQVLYFVVGGVVLIGAIVMGAVLLAVALGLAIVIGLVIFVRVWWLKRKFRAAAKQSESIEVEYTIVDERDEPDRRDRRGGDE
jgi:hypothetical protein